MRRDCGKLGLLMGGCDDCNYIYESYWLWIVELLGLYNKNEGNGISSFGWVVILETDRGTEVGGGRLREVG